MESGRDVLTLAAPDLRRVVGTGSQDPLAIAREPGTPHAPVVTVFGEAMPVEIPQCRPPVRRGRENRLTVDWIEFDPMDRVVVAGAGKVDVGGNADQGAAYAHRFGFGSYGAGTAGAGAQVPQLTGVGPATIGSGVSLDASNGLGGAPGAMLLGSGLASQVSIPVLGGTMLVLPAVSLPVVLGGSVGVAGDGTSSLPLTIPASASVIGVNLNFQAVFVDAVAPAGLSMTAAVDMWIG